MTDLVSVVIPTHGRDVLMRRTLETVLAQRDVDLEVVVVIDGVVDGTASYLTGLREDRLRVLVHQESRGVSAARNAGLSAARGVWTAFSDDDDLWLPDKLSRQLQALQRQPGAGWAVGGCVRVDAELQVRAAQHPPPAGDVAELMLRMNAVPGGGSGVVARTTLLREVGGFDPSLRVLADWDMWVRLALASPLATDDTALLAYVLHDAAMSRNLERVRRELELLRVKYAAERAARGVSLDEAHWLMWVLDLERRGGRRLASVRTAARRARLSPGLRRLAAIPANLAVPQRLVSRSDAGALASVPPAWRVRVQPFLAEVRASPSHRAVAPLPPADQAEVPRLRPR
jgi:glycosyltransferase involved in cell wall biosynthesis